MKKPKYITVVRQRAVNKKYSPSGDENAETIKDAKANTVRVNTPADLKKVLLGIADDPDAVVVNGYNPGTEPEAGKNTGLDYRMVYKDLYTRLENAGEDLSNTHSRLQSEMAFSGWIVFDFDPDPVLPAVKDFDDWSQKMAKGLPGFEAVGGVFTWSNSRRVLNVDGTPYKPVKATAHHFWVPVEEEMEQGYMTRSLKPAMERGGLCWAKKTLFDTQVGSSNTIVYEGQPRVEGGLVVIQQTAIAYDGESLALPEKKGLLTKLAARSLVERDGMQSTVLKWLRDYGMYQGAATGGWHDILCPWRTEHSGGGETGSFNDFGDGGAGWEGAMQYKCFHDHCEKRGIGDLLGWLANQEGAPSFNAAPSVDEWTTAFNESYRWVILESKGVYINRYETADGYKSRFLPFNVVKDDHLPKRASGRGSKKLVEDVFGKHHKHPKRKSYKGVVFEPQVSFAKPNEPELSDTEYFNLWEGYRYQPREGSWLRLRGHLYDVVCNGDRVKFEYLMDWFAAKVQHPGMVGLPYLVFQSDPGAGKGIIFEHVFKPLFGEHALIVEGLDRVTSNFNGLMAVNCLLCLNEALWGGNKQQIGALKALTTDPTRLLEKKYVDAIELPNTTSAFIFTNEKFPVPAEFHDRRYVFYEFNNQFADQASYFDPLIKAIPDEREALLHVLLQRKVGFSKVRRVPDWHSDLKQSAQYETADSLTKWWITLLDHGDGLPHAGFFRGAGCWETGLLISTESLYEDYEGFCKAKGIKMAGKLAINMFGKRIAKEFGSGHKVQRLPEADFGSARPPGFSFPPLKQLRAKTTEETGYVF